MQGMYSMRSPAVKRLMKEAQELREPTEQFHAQPLEDNLFEWHFTIRGPADSEFDGGFYHGRIVLPPEYPMKPPSIIILTHNGRFEVNKKICLSISGHHPESWQPSWSIRTAMLAIIGFMPTHGAGALGSLDYTPEERKILARRSKDYKCSECGNINNVLKAVTEESEKTKQEIKELASQIDFKDEKEKNEALKATKDPTDDTKTPTESSTTSMDPQQQTPNQQPLQNPFAAPFGQFPFRLPFMPPFPNQQGQTGSIPTQQNQQNAFNPAQIPRFPLPFVSPFMPPPPFMHSGNGPMVPGMGTMPGTMGPFPWPNVGMGSRPPFIPPSTGESGSGETTTTTTNVQPDSTATSFSTNDRTTTDTSSTTANTHEDSEIQQTPQPTPQESSSTEGASPDEGPSLRSQTTGVRRRLAASLQSEERNNRPSSATRSLSVPTPERQRATESQRQRDSESPLYYVFVSVIVLAIILLILRRLYVMKMLPINF